MVRIDSNEANIEAVVLDDRATVTTTLVGNVIIIV